MLDGNDDNFYRPHLPKPTVPSYNTWRYLWKCWKETIRRVGWIHSDVLDREKYPYQPFCTVSLPSTLSAVTLKRSLVTLLYIMKR
jgi:hypothetical protein